MMFRSLVIFLAFSSHVLHGWDLKSIEKKLSRQIRDVPDYTNWTRWKNASKVYANDSCEDELRPYIPIPPIITDPGTTYDVKALNVFKTIGDAFLEMITRKSLFDTIKLAMELSPIDSLSKVLKIVEYQLTMVILVILGVLTATFILVFYIIFWSLKLTGNIGEVKSQRIADSEGPMRFILSFLLSMFTVLVMFGCIIAWVANTHISNNVNEASKHIQWTVNVTENFTNSIEEQMNVLFLQDYREIQLGILRTRVNQAVINASADVYLEIAQNVSDMYNKSLMVADSIGNHQKINIVAIEALYKQYNETLYPFLIQLDESKSCLETIKKWCDASANSGKCDADKEIPSSYLTSVDPEKWYYDEIIKAKEDVLKIADEGQLGANARLAYFNGKFFHNGSLEDPNTKFYGEQPSYTNECLKTDLTTGKLLHTDNEVVTTTISKRNTETGETGAETGAGEETAPTTKTVPKNTIKTSITCSDAEGCRINGTATKLFWGHCCVSIQYFLNQSDPKVNNTDYTKCGPKEIKKDGVVQPGGNQSDYRGNTTVTLTGKTCLKWAEVDNGNGDDAVPWDEWAASEGYTGLFWNDDPEEITFKHSFCRNPSPQKGLYGTETDDDVKIRAWCFYGTKETEWEYCNVPFCAPSTAAALQLAATSGATAFEYPTCETMEKQIYGDVPTATNFTMWKTSTDARNGAYFALDEAASEMKAQYDVIEERFNATNEAFDSLKKTILNSISSESDASKFDNMRNIGTICIVTFCMMSACLAVAGVCMGYCNITDVPPHLRTTACSWGGRLIKISSYWAAMMAIINLFMATLFFIPGSAFSLVCKDYYAGKFFKLFDEKVVVDYYVLGRAVLGNDSYPMLFQYLLESCNQSKTLWTSLGLDLDPDYKIENMMQLNESLDVNYTISTLLDTVSLNFDEHPAYPDKLKEWLTFWNVSNATQVPWGSVKTNFANNFMGLTYSQVNTKSSSRIKIDNKEFCDAFAAYGAQVTETAGDVFQCKQLFINQKVIDPVTSATLNFKKTYCEEWIKNYEEMDGWIDNLQAKANLIQAQHAKYGPVFMKALIDEYDTTNNHLLNKGTNFSRAIINQTYINYWQPKINNEVGCFSWWVNQALHKDVVMCYPVAKILDNTMNYFCGYMVSAMTLAWMSQGLLGLVLAFHMLVASSLATYFLKLEERHPDDISKEDMIAGFQ